MVCQKSEPCRASKESLVYGMMTALGIKFKIYIIFYKSFNIKYINCFLIYIFQQLTQEKGMNPKYVISERIYYSFHHLQNMKSENRKFKTFNDKSDKIF